MSYSMKKRTGKECKKIHCVRHITYVNWAKNLGNGTLSYCMECKNAHVSQYQKDNIYAK